MTTKIWKICTLFFISISVTNLWASSPVPPAATQSVAFVYIPDAQFDAGTDLFFAGLFDLFPGDKRIQPIVRFGRLSMIPSERVPWGTQLEDLIIADIFSFGGNSGSPVFYYLGTDSQPGAIMVGAPTVKIAGVMQGFFEGNEPPSAQLLIDSPAHRTSRQAVSIYQPNSGIAAVVPAQKILDVLNSLELKSFQK